MTLVSVRLLLTLLLCWSLASDLKTIKEKLDKRLYETIGEFVRDMFLIFNNCRMYNPPSSPFFQCAEVLEIYFDKKQLAKLKDKLS